MVAGKTQQRIFRRYYASCLVVVLFLKDVISKNVELSRVKILKGISSAGYRRPILRPLVLVS